MNQVTMARGCVFLILVFVSAVSSIDRNKIQRTPRPMKHFRLDEILGGWYLIKFINPDSFDATGIWDAKFTYGVEGGKLVRRTRWWKGVCTQVDFTLKETDTPGIYYQKDNMGDMLTGLLIYLVRTRHYGIVWHCTQFGPNNECTDASILVEARVPNPPVGVWKAVEKYLRMTFDLTLAELFPMPFHPDLPCERGLHSKIK